MNSRPIAQTNREVFNESMMLRTVILIVTLIAVNGDKCVPRSFGENRIVCVCNSTYCDTVSNLSKLECDKYAYYTSTADGQRLELNVNKFSIELIDNEQSLIVDSTQKFQVIGGFGGAMTDATALNIRSLSNKTQKILLESYFGSTGIGYTYCRIPIAGTDFSTRPYTYDDTPNDDTLSNFSLVEEDDYKIEYLHQMKNMMLDPNSLRIFTTAWSAPAWMKNSNKISWGSLKSKYYSLYAEYILKFFEAYKNRGIDIWGITPGNEPLDGIFPFFPFNAMWWSPKNAAYWSTDYLYPTLSKAGYNLTYMAMDDQRFEIPFYIDIMFKNEKAKELFEGTAYHWYFDKIFSPLRLTRTHDKYPDKFILMTEACSGSNVFEKQKVILGSWERGEDYILDIIENLSHWVTGWVDWNMALNERGEPNWAKNYVDSPIIVIPKDDEFYKQPMYYALGHISSFVPRGSYRIFSLLEKGVEKDIKTIAFLTPKQEIVTIVVNKANEPYNITIKDSNAPCKKMNLYISARSFNTVIYSSEQQCTC